MTTSITRRAPRSRPLSLRSVRVLCDLMLESLDLSAAELSVLLTDDRRIRVLNERHRGKDSPTDVLSFPLDEDPNSPPPRLLGDVVISLDTAERQARSRRRPLLAEVRFLLAHGILHLLGYDHATRAQKRVMDRATRKLVRAAPLPDNAAKAGRRPRRSAGQRRKGAAIRRA